MDFDLPVSISENAFNEILKIISDKNIPENYGLRVGLKGAGCGATYILGFDLAQPTDDIFHYESIEIFIERKHIMYVLGLHIHFEDGEEGQGFTFEPKENLQINLNE